MKFKLFEVARHDNQHYKTLHQKFVTFNASAIAEL